MPHTLNGVNPPRNTQRAILWITPPKAKLIHRQTDGNLLPPAVPSAQEILLVGAHDPGGEQNHDDDAQRNAVGGEPGERVVGDELQQPRNGDVTEDETDDGADQ